MHDRDTHPARVDYETVDAVTRELERRNAVRVEALLARIEEFNGQSAKSLSIIEANSTEHVANSRRAAADASHTRESMLRTERAVGFCQADVSQANGRMGEIEVMLGRLELMMKDIISGQEQIKNAIVDLWKRVDPSVPSEQVIPRAPAAIHKLPGVGDPERP